MTDDAEERRGDAAVPGRGDAETRRHAEGELAVSPPGASNARRAGTTDGEREAIVPSSPRLRVPASPPVVYFERGRLGAESPAWRRVRSEIVADCRVFRVRRDVSLSPRGDAEHDFFVVEAGDWINIIPLTEDGEVVMIEQYRHGSLDVTLEIPGGMVDEGESPGEAAAREMIEETGYASDDVVALGRVRPNPAIHDNWLHTFLARGVRFTRAPVFDSTEHTAVRLVPLADIPSLIGDGAITHALVVVAFHWLTLWQQNLVPGR